MSHEDKVLREFEAALEDVAKKKIALTRASVELDEAKAHLAAKRKRMRELLAGAGRAAHHEAPSPRPQRAAAKEGAPTAAEPAGEAQANLEEVARVLAGRTEPATAAIVAAALGVSQSIARTRLGRAAAANLIKRDGHGKYMPLDGGKTDAPASEGVQ